MAVALLQHPAVSEHVCYNKHNGTQATAHLHHVVYFLKNSRRLHAHKHNSACTTATWVGRVLAPAKPPPVLSTAGVSTVPVAAADTLPTAAS